MQKFSAWRKCVSPTHFFFSTSSVCIIAIWPVGPPKEMKPSFSQKRKASAKDGRATRVSSTAKFDRSRFIPGEYVEQDRFCENCHAQPSFFSLSLDRKD